ncbi:unnamed protein product [Trichogramma brassicae]|uniref:Uncharacterized protein n=1 Tax=Trichogramma brassicae TaxID=86971 RepID=A0A6H5IV36_9HYME|nr:unnamed protein product [Trichogramma brassicae]
MVDRRRRRRPPSRLQGRMGSSSPVFIHALIVGAAPRFIAPVSAAVHSRKTLSSSSSSPCLSMTRPHPRGRSAAGYRVARCKRDVAVNIGGPHRGLGVNNRSNIRSRRFRISFSVPCVLAPLFANSRSTSSSSISTIRSTMPLHSSDPRTILRASRSKLWISLAMLYTSEMMLVATSHRRGNAGCDSAIGSAPCLGVTARSRASLLRPSGRRSTLFHVDPATHVRRQFMTGRPRLTCTTTSRTRTRIIRLFARCARRLFRMSGAPDDHEVVADERHKRLISYATTWPASTGISGFFTGNVGPMPR